MDPFPGIYCIEVFYVCSYTFVVIKRFGIIIAEYWQVGAGFYTAPGFLFTCLIDDWLAYCLQASNRAPVKEKKNSLIYINNKMTPCV